MKKGKIFFEKEYRAEKKGKNNMKKGKSSARKTRIRQQKRTFR